MKDEYSLPPKSQLLINYYFDFTLLPSIYRPIFSRFVLHESRGRSNRIGDGLSDGANDYDCSGKRKEKKRKEKKRKETSKGQGRKATNLESKRRSRFGQRLAEQK